MGRTYRRTEGEYGRRGPKDGGRVVREVVEDSPTPTWEWAVARMSEHVNHELEEMIAQRIISSSDKEFYAELLNDRIRAGVDAYDAAHVNDEGRTSTLCHFLTVVVDRRIATLREQLWRLRRWNERLVRISSLSSAEAECFGYVSGESLSDGCRSVRDLEWRLDVRSLVGLLTKPEAIVFQVLMDGGSQREAERVVGITGGSFRRGILDPLREKCRLCGFEPKRRDEG